MSKRMVMTALSSLFLIASATGCGNSTKPDAKTAAEALAPTFNISSRPVSGDPTLMTFSASCDLDVNLIKVVITNPEGVRTTYNLDNTLLVAGQRINLQEYGWAYYRVGGQWSFRFVGTHASGASAGASFDITSHMDASGKPGGGPLGSIGRKF